MPETGYLQTRQLPPHIRSTDSLAKRFWGQGIALLPIFIASCFTGHAGILRVLLICLVSVVSVEFLIAKLSGKKDNLHNGEAVLTAALFSLLVPSRCASEIIIFGVFIISIIRALFGGTGTYPLQPLLLARAILQLSFSNKLGEPMLLAGGGNLWVLVSIGLGGVLLMSQKKGYWETPVFFIATCVVVKISNGAHGITAAFLSSILFIAFFLLADPVVLPLTRRGNIYFVLGAGILSSCLEADGFSISAATCALLWMGLITPWLDVLIRPVTLKSQKFLKATYPR